MLHQSGNASYKSRPIEPARTANTSEVNLGEARQKRCDRERCYRAPRIEVLPDCDRPGNFVRLCREVSPALDTIARIRDAADMDTNPEFAVVCRREELPSGPRLTVAGPVESLQGARLRLFAERESRPIDEVYVLIPATWYCTDCKRPAGSQHRPSCHRQGIVTEASDYQDRGRP